MRQGEGKPGGRRCGFTLMELLIMVVILGVMAAVAVPRFIPSAVAAKKTACAHNAASINSQVERWFYEKGTWPKGDLSDIGADPEYFPDPPPTCPVDGSAYSLSGTTHRVQGHSH